MTIRTKWAFSLDFSALLIVIIINSRKLWFYDRLMLFCCRSCLYFIQQEFAVTSASRGSEQAHMCWLQRNVHQVIRAEASHAQSLWRTTVHLRCLQSTVHRAAHAQTAQESPLRWMPCDDVWRIWLGGHPSGLIDWARFNVPPNTL